MRNIIKRSIEEGGEKWSRGWLRFADVFSLVLFLSLVSTLIHVFIYKETMYINICICRRCVYPRRVHLDVNNTARKEEEEEEEEEQGGIGRGQDCRRNKRDIICRAAAFLLTDARPQVLRLFASFFSSSSSSSSSSCRFLFLSFSLLELSVCVIGVNVWSAPKHMNQESRTNGHDPHPSAGRLRRDKTAPKRAPCCVPPNRYNSISRQHRWWLSLFLFFYFFIFFSLVALWLASLGSFSPGRLNQQHHTHTFTQKKG